MKKEEKTRPPINVSVADLERAYKNVEKFKRLLERGKTPEQIFEDLIRLTEVDKKQNSDDL